MISKDLGKLALTKMGNGINDLQEMKPVGQNLGGGRVKWLGGKLSGSV